MVEEQRAQKSDRFLRGRQIAYMIYEYFRATGAFEAVQGLSDLFRIRLHNDDGQDFDVRWDQALLSVSEMPSDVILEGLHRPKLQDSVQLQTVLALYDQETVRNNGKTNYLRLKTAIQLHIDQMMRTRNFRVRNEVVERGSVTKSQKERKSTLRGKWESVFSGRMDNVPQEIHVVLVMTQRPLAAVAKVRDQKDDRLVPHQIRRQRLTVKKATKWKVLTREIRLCADTKIVKKKRKNRRCKCWHLPVCQNYKSGKGCILWRHMSFPTC